MKKSTLLSKASILSAALLFIASSAWASDIEWSGIYRIEGIHISNPEMGGAKHELDYGLHHLSLRPKIVVGDGITVNGQFDLFNNSSYPDSQLGAYLGGGVGTGTPTNSDNSNTISSHEKSGGLAVSELYLTWIHEYGSLIVWFGNEL